MMRVVPLLSITVLVGSCLAHAGGGAANNPQLRFSQAYHWTFSEIGDVGNAAHHIPPPAPGFPSRPVGSVDYRYRIATTEVTFGQYYEFVLAYAPVAPKHLATSLGTGPIIFGGVIDGIPRYSPPPADWVNRPVGQTWHLWARYVNWLNAGGPDITNPTSADFEMGAYDTSTFGRVEGPDGIPYRTDQDSHTPGSRFWIPSHDEWVKATYYDPNRYGEGQGGYWQFGHSSDDPPIPGDPALGGETNGGTDQEWPTGQARPFDVGSYPNAQSPWGLFDTAGSATEWTETWIEENPLFHNQRVLMWAAGGAPIAWGEIDHLQGTFPTTGFGGLRLAMAIPAPGAASVLALSALLAARRRR